MGEVQEIGERVLICAPHGRDAHLIESVLTKNGIYSEVLQNLRELSTEFLVDAGAAIVTEEALYTSMTPLVEAMKNQPPWSDLPVIVLTNGGEVNAEKTWALLRRLEPIGNVSLLERPLRSVTLVSAVQVALRSRARQYEVRALNQDLERRVDERTAELQRLNAEAEGFSYTIAHDLRTPLRGIISTSYILLEDHAPELSSEAVEELKRQAEAAARLAKLIDDLLSLSRLSREEMRSEWFDLTYVANEVADEISKGPPQTSCRFEIQPDMTAKGDALLVRFALLNLMQNACKFSPDGGIVKVERDGDTFVVADQGIGFNPDYATRIFQPFERLEDRQSFPGTGIGLANVKRIVERHGGQVWAESTPGVGSTFYFRLSPDPSSPPKDL